MKSNRQLKQQAKEMLRGNWGSAILMNLIPMILLFIIFIIILIPAIFLLSKVMDSSTVSTAADFSSSDYSFSDVSISFGSSLIGTFFSLAMTWTFLDMFRKVKTQISPLKDAFRTFKLPHALGILVIFILSSIFTFLWTILFIIPGIIKQFSYSQAYNIYYDSLQNDSQPIGYLDSITKSRRMMNGHKWQLFVLQLSFIGWFIICIPTFGIGLLWLVPYISASEAAFYDNLPKEA